MDKERIFLHRDKESEMLFINDYLSSLNRANKWVIPIMKKFGIPITLDSVIEYSIANDLRKAVVDYSTRKALDGIDADLVRAIDINNQNKVNYDQGLKELIASFAEIEVKKEREMIENKKDSDSDFFFKGGVKIRKYLSKEHILGLLPEKKIIHTRKLEEEYENIAVTAEQNFRLRVSQCKLASSRDFLILDGETLKFDDIKIQDKFAVYAEGKNEIKLIEKLKQLANLTNEIYGENFYNSDFAFNIFFKQTKDGVKINPDIKKKDITAYSKNV